jgi:5-methylcytosine-specific restriction endonuclease McrA
MIGGLEIIAEMHQPVGQQAPTKICTKCGPPAQAIENFAIRNRSRGTRQAMCRKCQSHYLKAHYQVNRSKYLAKARARNIEQSKVNAAFLIEYLAHHPCADCGESDIVVLEFDHQRNKLSTISELSREGYSLAKLEQEIAKCEVVCANCHRRRTAKQFGWYRLL